jgi:hypothetical protein
MKEMKRPLGMTIILPLLGTANVFGGIKVVLNRETLLASYPRLTDGALSFILVVLAASTLGLAATWTWKRWGAVFVSLAYVLVLAFDFLFEIYYHPIVATVAIALYWFAVWPVRTQLR